MTAIVDSTASGPSIGLVLGAARTTARMDLADTVHSVRTRKQGVGVSVGARKSNYVVVAGRNFSGISTTHGVGRPQTHGRAKDARARRFAA